MKTTNSIFVFDHGQKKINKAIGVEESYMDEIQDKVSNIMKNYIFDEERNLREDTSPSMLVESCLHEFSYNQLVILAAQYINNRMEAFADKLEEKVNSIKTTTKKIALDADDLPPHVREFFEKMSNGASSGVINGNDLPDDIKKFLDGLTRSQEQDEE